MLIVSTAVIRFRRTSKGVDIMVEGDWEPYKTRILHWFGDLPLKRATVRLRWGRIIFSGVPDELHQRIRNFLFNECPVKG